MRNPYIYAITGLMTFALAACGGAQEPTTDASGNWDGQLIGESTALTLPFTMSLDQSDTKLTGTLALAGSPAIPISGEVDDNRVTISSGYQSANLEILGTVDNSTMIGTMTLNLAGQPLEGSFTATK